MRGSTPAPWIVIAALGAAAGCAEVLGLDEPTVRDAGTTGTGAAASTGSTTTAGTGGGDAVTSTSTVGSTGTEATTTTSSGHGGGGGGLGGGGQGGGAGGEAPIPCRVDADCGAATICGNPTCDQDAGICDPGYVTGDLPDDVDGDCQRPACGGRSPDAISVADDADSPTPLPPCTLSCLDGALRSAPAGSACSVQGAVCSGEGMGVDACKRCIESAAEVDPGCSAAGSGRYCDETRNGGDGACVSCLVDVQCVADPLGPVCRSNGNCGCDADAQCSGSPYGTQCTALQFCSCESDADCTDSARGSSCEFGTCGCDSDADCTGVLNGERCHPSGECFCQDDDHCADGLTCNLVDEVCTF